MAHQCDHFRSYIRYESLMIKYSWPAMTTALRNLFNFIGLLAISIYVSFIAVIREKETITFSFNLYCAHRATCSLLKLHTHLICLQRGTCFYRTMMSKPLRAFQVHVHISTQETSHGQDDAFHISDNVGYLFSLRTTREREHIWRSLKQFRVVYRRRFKQLTYLSRNRCDLLTDRQPLKRSMLFWMKFVSFSIFTGVEESLPNCESMR